MSLDLGKIAKGLITTSAKKAVSKTATKTVKSTQNDLSSLVTLATKNTDVIGILGKLGALKSVVEPEEPKAQALVKQLYNLLKKNTKLPITEEMFSKIFSKVLSSSTVKAKIAKLAGSNTAVTFIKKAISAFVA